MSQDVSKINQDSIIISSRSLEGNEKFAESSAKIEDKIDSVEKKFNLYIQGHQYRITHFHLSFDYDYLLSYSMDHYIKIWDIKNNIQVTTHFFHDAQTLCIFPNFKYIIASKDNNFYILKLNIPDKHRKKIQENNKRKFTKSIDLSKTLKENEDYNLLSSIIKKIKLPGIFPLSCFVLSINRKYAVVGCFDRTIRIFNIIKGSQKQIFPGHNIAITTLTVSNDRKYLVSASCDGYLKTWHIENSQQISCALYDKGISAIAIAKDNSCIVAISNKCIYKMTLNLIEIVRKDTDFNLYSIDIALNKNRIILYGGLFVNSNVEEIDLKTLKSVSKWKLELKGKYIRMTNDCNYGIVSYSYGMWFWKITKNKYKVSYNTIVKSLSLIQNDEQLISATKTSIFQFTLKTKKCKKLFTCPKGFTIHSISSDQTLVICQSNNRTSVFNILKNKKIADFNSMNNSYIVISYNNKFLLASNLDYTFWIIDLTTKTIKAFEDIVRASFFAIFHNDEYFVTFYEDTIFLWNIKELKFECKIAENCKYCKCFAITKDDSLLIYGNEGCLSIWDLRGNIYKGNLLGCKGEANVIRLSEDCMFVASGFDNGDIIVWNLQEMKLVYVLKGHKRSVVSIAITQNMSMIYSGSISGLVRVWDLIKKEQIQEIYDFQYEESVKMWRKYPELDDLHEWV
ncbi:hypothetical protein SteCoe_4616 [Stentor coeruleus]|uniref:Anaphase-promoting complex subunit 4 WD40 domain-containing protein n=1 Tax=Stentor coeruleus TaxID=5963 RepID=A0A1R2CUA6_9CILI|nr:hypothetical protein SteCoe_4616 [Stentor coeruleus]